MEDIVTKVLEFNDMLIGLFVGIQAVVLYFLPPEKAVKFNFLGKILDLLIQTKAGLSNKKADDGSIK